MIQNTEFYSSEKQCYILIHKNACSTILYNLKEEFGTSLYEGPNSSGIRWTVTRDPYDRLMSSIAYDIRQQYPIKVWDSERSIINILQNIDFTKYIVNNVPHVSNVLGTAQHSILQSIYLFDNNVDILVDIKDLEHFIPMHFRSTLSTQNVGISVHKDSITRLMEGLPDIKITVLGLLEMDYIMLNSMRSQGRMWSWGSGKIW